MDARRAATATQERRAQNHKTRHSANGAATHPERTTSLVTRGRTPSIRHALLGAQSRVPRSDAQGASGTTGGTARLPFLLQEKFTAKEILRRACTLQPKWALKSLCGGGVPSHPSLAPGLSVFFLSFFYDTTEGDLRLSANIICGSTSVRRESGLEQRYDLAANDRSASGRTEESSLREESSINSRGQNMPQAGQSCAERWENPREQGIGRRRRRRNTQDEAYGFLF